MVQGCRQQQLFRTGGGGGGANKVKTKELQFGSKGRVQDGAEAKFFFKIQEV